MHFAPKVTTGTMDSTLTIEADSAGNGRPVKVYGMKFICDEDSVNSEAAFNIHTGDGSTLLAVITATSSSGADNDNGVIIINIPFVADQGLRITQRLLGGSDFPAEDLRATIFHSQPGV